jgi:hypothetical protein
MVKGILAAGDAVSTSTFQGYVFHQNRLHHASSSSPNLASLWAAIDDACGVFVATLSEGGHTRIFTDPLSQFPVFYHLARGIVATDLYALRDALEPQSINEECINDYLSYLSPMCQDTLIPGVKRLKPYETIVIDAGRMQIVARPRPTHCADYADLLAEASDRLRARAEALASAHQPVVHLSGGLDSRLSFAAMASVGYKGSVFSYGDGSSDDRIISHLLAERWSVAETGIKWFHRTATTIPEYEASLRPFNGMKILNLANYGTGSDFSYSEVTGYFSEALLKGFGSFWAGGRLTMFDYGRKTTSFDSSIFDLPEERATKEAKEMIELAEGNIMMANCLFYLQNRSAGHFGAHSVVNNQRLISIDLIYDPFLLNLIQTAPYTATEIKAGAIVLDLIRKIHSEELAAFPYDNRQLPRFSQWTHEVAAPSCFEPGNLPRMDLPRLPVETVGSPVPKRGLSLTEAERHFRWVEQRFPLLRPSAEGTRNVEKQALLSLCCLISDFDTTERARATG